jgi:small-conductance mechanosensitive channel
VEDLIDSISGNQLFASAILIAAMIALRFTTDKWLETRAKLEPDERRRIKSNIKNALFLLCLFSLVFVWAPSLRTFALSLTAFAVAIILATKELILCLSGYALKSASGMIRVGDWIEINSMRGEVVELDLMTTTVEELGTGPKAYEYTGKTITLPNSLFLGAALKNERFNKRYTYHSFNIVINPEIPARPLCEKLTEALEKEVLEFQDVATRYKTVIEKRAEITLSNKFVSYHIDFLNDGHINIKMTCFAPTQDAIGIENRAKTIASDYISNWYAAKES